MIADIHNDIEKLRNDCNGYANVEDGVEICKKFEMYAIKNTYITNVPEDVMDGLLEFVTSIGHLNLL